VDRDQERNAVTDERLRRIAKDLTPPVVARGARKMLQARDRTPPEWQHVPEGWAYAAAGLRGWDDQTVLDAYRAKLPEFRAAVEGPGPLGHRTSAAFTVGTGSLADQNTMLAFAYALLLASRQRDRLSILDWGGGLGFHSFVARAVLPSTVALEYHCKELPAICELGRAEVPDITFWSDDRALERTYDLVLASSSLQYSEDWETDLDGLARATGDSLFLTAVPVVLDHPSFVVLQRTRGYRFDTEYLSWVCNRDALLARVAVSGLTLEREFLLQHAADVVGAPAPNETRAFLFRRS
jgi:putative methyltransferase (TIGR04325 family)